MTKEAPNVISLQEGKRETKSHKHPSNNAISAHCRFRLSERATTIQLSQYEIWELIPQ